MSSATEIRESRVGLSISSQGATNWHTMWHVVVDDPDDNPLTVLRTKVPDATPHPWDLSLRADGWKTEKRLSPTLWLCRVTYATLRYVSIRGIGAWKVKVRGATTSEHIRETIPVYRTVGRLRTLQKPKLIGSIEYETVKKSEDATNKAVDGDNTIWLKATSRRNVVGHDRPRSSVVYTLYRTQPVFDLKLVGTMVSFSEKVNKYLFLGAAPGHLMLNSFDVTESSGTMFGSSNDRVWSISLSWLFSPVAFSPLNKVHTFTADSGAELVVETKDGKPVTEEFPVIEEVDFADLLSRLG